jgi:hypothetical protein
MNRFQTGLIGTLFLGMANVASAAVIENVSSWDGSQYISSFGESNTATYGQTFTVGADNRLDSFTFFINDRVNPDFIDFRAYIMGWNGVRATGPILWESGDLSTSNNSGADGFEQFDLLTGGVDLLSGQQYVAFFSASELFDGVIGSGVMGAMHSNTYDSGNFVYMNNGDDFSQLTSNSWDQWLNSDLAFEMGFNTASVPEPSTLLLLTVGLAGLGFTNRTKKKA